METTKARTGIIIAAVTITTVNSRLAFGSAEKRSSISIRFANAPM